MRPRPHPLSGSKLRLVGNIGCLTAFAVIASCAGKTSQSGDSKADDVSAGGTGGEPNGTGSGRIGSGGIGSGGVGSGGRIDVGTGGEGGASDAGDDLSQLVPLPHLEPDCENEADAPLPFPGRIGAQRIVEALWNEPTLPDLPLDPDAITTYGELVEYALLVLGDPRIEGGIGDFVLHLFKHTPGADFAFAAGAELPPEATPELFESLVDSARQLGTRMLLGEVPGTLSYLLTTDEGHVDENLADLYGIEWGEADDTWQSLPHRTGLFTNPYFLVRTSRHPFTVAPIRGTRLQELLTCVNLPVPPVLGPNSFSDWSSDETARQYWERTVLSTTPCASCHTHITPLGLGFEKYDSLGRFREVEGGQVIDPTTRFSHPDLGEATFSDPSRFLEYFSTYPATQTCMTTRLLEIVLGRTASGRSLPDERLSEGRIRRLASCAIDPDDPTDIDLRRLIAHMVASVDFQLTFRCGHTRCSRDIEICRTFEHDGEIESASCIAVSPVACPSIEDGCSCSHVGDEVTYSCALD